MKIDSVVVGSYRANCYVLREGTSMIVIDPGDEPAEVLGLIGSADDVQIVASHCHCDHIGAVNEVVEAYGASFAVGREDGHAVADPRLSGFDEEGRDYRVEKVDRLLDDGDEIALGPYRFQVISTPGHTPGSVCLYCRRDRAHGLHPRRRRGDAPNLFQARNVSRLDDSPSRPRPLDALGH